MLFDIVDVAFSLTITAFFSYVFGSSMAKWRFMKFLERRRKSFETWKPAPDSEIFKIAHINELNFIHDRLGVDNYRHD